VVSIFCNPAELGGALTAAVVVPTAAAFAAAVAAADITTAESYSAAETASAAPAAVAAGIPVRLCSCLCSLLPKTLHVPIYVSLTDKLLL
jgi:hypothetical protein